MDLVIDIGNSRAKVAWFDGAGQIVGRASFDEFGVAEAQGLLEGVDRAILASTRTADAELEAFLAQKLEKFVVFRPRKTPTPLKIAYRTPETLGADRLAAAVAAWGRFPDQDIWVVDCGTALTIDFVSKEGVYEGGVISAGLAMRLSALHERTARLPLCSPDEATDQMLGTDTRSALVQGAVWGIVHEIEGYAARTPGAKIFFTGGDAVYFEKRIRTAIFADADAVLNGLHAALTYLE